ncbi:hypothetical protein ANN_08968 [Periplaneta americana]|uniref:Uncharacterized protein n=1 Tax=Periplaneta americana TaxID=6978 RepID=A0ABQ8T2R2_PERAM|nr:hypothetical protein ANN_08968 [Periplaneta americana]
MTESDWVATVRTLEDQSAMIRSGANWRCDCWNITDHELLMECRCTGQGLQDVPSDLNSGVQGFSGFRLFSDMQSKDEGIVTAAGNPILSQKRIPNLTGLVDNNDVTLQRIRNKTAGRIDGCHGDCVVVIIEDVQNVHLLLEYRPHIDVSLTCEHDPKLQDYCVCPQNMPQFDSEGILNQAPETNKPMSLNGPTSRNREGSDQPTPTIGATHPHPYHRQLHIVESRSSVVKETLKTTTHSVETGRLSKNLWNFSFTSSPLKCGLLSFLNGIFAEIIILHKSTLNSDRVCFSLFGVEDLCMFPDSVRTGNTDSKEEFAAALQTFIARHIQDRIYSHVDTVRSKNMLAFSSDERAFNIESFSHRYCRSFAYVVSRFPQPAFIRQLVVGLS